MNYLNKVVLLPGLLIKSIKIKGGLILAISKFFELYKKGGLQGLRVGLVKVYLHGKPGTFIQSSPVANSDGHDRNDYPYWSKKYNSFSLEEYEAQKVSANSFDNKPLISIVMPVYNPNPEWLEEVINSITEQTYQNWQLCIADDCSTDSRVKEVLRSKAMSDARIDVVFREKNGHISNASNSALEIANGKWIALVDHDDLLPKHALYEVVKSINENPQGKLFYSDEDKVNEDGVYFEPYFKTDWNRTLFYSHNMICHLGVYLKEIVDDISGFRVGLEGAQDYDLALRYIEKIEDNQIIHIPKVLYHWRSHKNSTASATSDAKPYAMVAGEKALNEHFVRIGLNAKAELTKFSNYRIKYGLPEIEPLVSIIIPTRNGKDLVHKCINSIETKMSYSNYEIILIDNGSDDKEALEYFNYLDGKNNITVVRDNSPFNYSKLNNKAVKLSNGEFICLLNNDVEVISEDWLTELLSRATLPNVGVVGAKLYYPNDTIQHAGVILGIGGVAGHAFKCFPKNNLGYMGRASIDSEYTAVTAACFVVKKSIFEQVGGLNEIDLSVAFNDVDFCLKVYNAGYRNIFTPHAELYHHESITRGYEDTPEKMARFGKEVAYMKNTWGKLLANDPAYNPNLSLECEDFSLKWK